MENEEILKELESLVEATEQSFAIIVGTLAQLNDPGLVLKNFLASENAARQLFGPNEWRDRFVRRMEQIAALKAKTANPSDAETRNLIATVLARHQDPIH
jgi:hypothetical protein